MVFAQAYCSVVRKNGPCSTIFSSEHINMIFNSSALNDKHFSERFNFCEILRENTFQCHSIREMVVTLSFASSLKMYVFDRADASTSWRLD